MSISDITILNRKRGNIKSQLTKLFAFLEERKRDLNELRVKEESLRQAALKLEQLKSEYYALVTDADLAEVESAFSEIEDDIDKLQVKFKIEINPETSASNRAVSGKDEGSFECSIKLPDIPLPTFTGNYSEFYNFKGQFSSLIVQNQQLTSTQKLYYLKSALRGEARGIITSHDTFASLFKALEERYENKRAIVDSHVQSILNFDKISHESYRDLRGLLDKILSHVRALKTLGYESNNLSEVLLINVILQKLDRETRRQFELSLNTNEVPTWDIFVSFLEKRCNLLESLNRNAPFKQKPPFEQNLKSKTLMLSRTSHQKLCLVCGSNENHALYKCSTFVNMNSGDRFEFVKRNKLCYNCLSFHKLSACRSKYKCSTCNKPHHTLLHRNNPEFPSMLSESKPSVEGRERSDRERENVVLSTTSHWVQQKTVLLSTAIVFVANSQGIFIKCRCILDNGSMCHFISSEFANKLGLKKQRTHVPVSTINGSFLQLKSKVQTIISNEANTYFETLEFLILPGITDLVPSNWLEIDLSDMPKEIQLADPDFYKPEKVDLLIGAEIFFDLLREGKFRLQDNVIMQNTVFGYIVSGSLRNSAPQNNQYCGLSVQIDELDSRIRRFWEIESIGEESRVLSPEEDFCEQHFRDNHFRNDQGRYVVKLPFKSDAVLGESRGIAEKRLNSLWRRLNVNSKMKSLYVNFMEEYETLGHMKEVSNGDSKTPSYYMPHHGVYRPEKQTTPLRVVFNASSPTSNGVSLNDILLNGGFIQNELFSIILRFRTHKYVFTADVQKMYRQVLIHPEHRDYQRILWKTDIDGPIKTYQLQTVTYGTASASFLATRALNQLAHDEGSQFPLAAAVVLSDFYVDDVLSGSDSLTEAKETKMQLIHLLQRGGMVLHKWCSNNKELCENMSANSERSFQESVETSTKALGMLWRPASDTFYFKVSLKLSDSYTKRGVLSSIAQIFDPMGLIGPVTTKAKIFMQSLWTLKVNWNDTLPESVISKWRDFVSTLPAIESFQIPRCLGCDGRVFLHGFADASSLAYGCSIYLQCVSADNKISTRLVCSKSRVAPLKTVSIPRLELCACLLLAKLVNKVLPALRVNIDKVFLWSDSTIALAWIHKPPSVLKTFVANRVTCIQDLTSQCQWNHVASELNPADIISRGVDANYLIQNSLWWHGPPFLTERTDFTRDIFHTFVDSDITLSEMKSIQNSAFTAVSTDNLFQNVLARVSNYVKLIRAFSFVYRFIHNCRCPQMKFIGPLSTKEYKNAESQILKEMQRSEFSIELGAVRKKIPVSPKSKLRFLNPFLGEDGILRVGGRLKHSSLNFESKFPIILPPKNKLTNLIIEHYHLKYLHIGPTGLLNCLRQKFWPINGRNLARRIVHSCVKCFKANPISSEQMLGDLPHDRVNLNYVFNSTGIDFCGPFFIRFRNQRKGLYHKIYVCIFVCMATRAVHLEMVTDLTSESFIATLKRFFSRRGKSARLFSDNAKTFVGAYSELKKLRDIVNKPDEQLAGYLSSEEIQWSFIPPRSPNFGGLWEAGVKSFKYHLKRTMGDAKLTMEEFLTLINQIEGILNSRPLTPLSSDPEDLNVLTPGHFLIGRPITSLPELNHTVVSENRLSQWQRVTRITQNIWKKWSGSFLSNLQQRSKWMFAKDNVKIGSLAIVKEENMPVCSWLMGRITEVFPGQDGKIRVVMVKTKNGTYKRSISKICILPIENCSVT